MRSRANVLVAALLAVASVLPTATAGADVEVRVAVLGDSYVSGEGLPSAVGECGRTEESWGFVVGTSLGDPVPQNVACTGATVADVTVGGDGRTESQVSAVTGAVDVAVLVVSGNDLGFSDLVADCLDLDEQVSPGAFDGQARSTVWRDLVGTGRRALGCEVERPELLAVISEFGDGDRFELVGGGRGRLAAVYEGVADAVLVPGGTLVVATYPALFHPSEGWATRYGRRCHGVLVDDADSFVAVSTALASRIEEEAAVAAAQLEGRASVVVVDVRALAAGVTGAGGDSEPHGLCGPGVPWLNGLTLVEGGIDATAVAGALLDGRGDDVDLGSLGARPSASFHPNTAGHAGIADAVATEVRAGTSGEQQRGQ